MASSKRLGEPVALRIREHAGFLDTDVFDVLTCHSAAPGIVPQFDDKDPFNCYLREIAMQRWLIYSDFKKVSRKKAARVSFSQLLACVAVLFVIVFVSRPFTADFPLSWSSISAAVTAICK